MGNSQGSAFWEKFGSVAVKERSEKELWVQHAATLPMPEQDTAAAAVIGEYEQRVAGEIPAAADGLHVTLLKINTNHRFYRASLTVPKSLGTDHPSVVPSQYRLMYDMLGTAHQALEWVRAHPHPSLLPVREAQLFRDSESVVAVSPATGIERVQLLMPFMTSSEILFGMTCVASALQHLHAHGMAHRNLSWSSIFVLTGSSEHRWCLGELHMLGPATQLLGPGHAPHTQPFDAARDYVAETRGLRDDAAARIAAPELSNPYVAGTLAAALAGDAAGTPGSAAQTVLCAADVFAFGNLLQQLVNSDALPPGTKSSSGTSAYRPALPELQSPLVIESCGCRAVLDSLLKYSKQCQAEDPWKRPAIREFLFLPCVRNSVYVSTMMQLNSALTAAAPRPEDASPGGGVGGEAAAVAVPPQLSLPASRADPAHSSFWGTLHMQIYKLPYEAVTRRVVPRLLTLHVLCRPEAEAFVLQLLTPITKLQGPGCLHLPISQANREQVSGTMTGDAIAAAAAAHESSRHKSSKSAHTKNASAAPSKHEEGSSECSSTFPLYGVLLQADYLSLVGSALQEMIGTLRKGMVGSGSSSHAWRVAACVLLRHIKKYLSYVPFSTTVAQHLIPFCIESLKHPDGAVVEAALAACVLVFTHLCASASTGSPQDKQIEASIDELSTAFNTGVFSLACGDANSTVRVAALQLAAKSLVLGRAFMSREKAITALCSSLLLSLPEATTPASEATLAASAAVAGRCAALLLRFLDVLTPAEMTQDVVPAALLAYKVSRVAADPPLTSDSGAAADGAAPQGAALRRAAAQLAETCMKLVLGIYAQLGQPSDPTASHPATPSEAPETSSTAVADEVDDQDDEDAAAQDPRRPPFAVRRDGWLTVSDPVDFVCHAWRRNAKDVGRGARRVDAPPGIIDEQKDAATRNSSSEPPGKILSGAAGSSMGFFSFVDYDHEWNTAPIFVVTRACAEVLQGSSHVAFTSSTKLHPLGMHLPSRAAAAAGGGSSSVKGTAGRRGSFTSDQSQSHNEASSSKKTRAGTAGGTQPAAAQSQREASGGGVAADDAKTAAAPAAASPCSTAEQQPIKEAAAHSGSLKAPEEGKAVPRRRRPLAEATSDTLEL